MFTWLDLVVLGVMLLSALLAMTRGLTREVLSILAWGSAAGAALVAILKFRDVARANISPNWLADATLALGTFFVVLVIVSYITVRISDAILDSRIGALDRTLGFVFGLGRGLLLIVIAFMFFQWLVPENLQPHWVAGARFKPVLQNTGNALVALLPEDPEKAISNLKRKGEPEPNEAPDAAPEPSTDKPGYRRSERQDMDRIIESARGPRR
jgi:membrane protein required for colicin V production